MATLYKTGDKGYRGFLPKPVEINEPIVFYSPVEKEKWIIKTTRVVKIEIICTDLYKIKTESGSTYYLAY